MTERETKAIAQFLRALARYGPNGYTYDLPFRKHLAGCGISTTRAHALLSELEELGVTTSSQSSVGVRHIRLTNKAFESLAA